MFWSRGGPAAADDQLKVAKRMRKYLHTTATNESKYELIIFTTEL